MSRRTWLISVSVVGHLAVGVGLFASGVWKIEKLDSDSRMASIGIMTPVMASGGGPQDLPAPNFVKKEKTEKKVVTNVQWDKRVEDDKAKDKKLSESGEEPGEGEGPGKGKGKGPGDQEGEPEGEPCLAPPCGGVAKLPEPPKLPVLPPVVNVPPQIMAALRISGETQIHPSRVVQNQILADGKSEAVGTLKVCMQPSGAIASVSVISSTKYPEYDQQLLAAARRWHYRPHTVDGVAVGACSAVRFVYSIK
jgi:TonB family protein